jgi:hypothetical protein
VAAREDLEIVLKVITEGKNAEIPTERKRELFGAAPDKVMESLRDKAEKWIGSRSVQGLAVGKKSVKGRQTDELVIVVYVDRKRPRDKVRNPVPRRITIPGIGSVETDVVAIGRVEPEQFTDRVRPAMPGCSVGHHAMITMGTFGLLVRGQAVQGGLNAEALGPASFVLSNSHVLAQSGLGSHGDIVIQPGPGDVDGSDGVIAKLERWIPFNFTKQSWPNLVDAAIAKVVRANSVTNSIREIDVIPVNVSTQILEGMSVHKVGRTTDLTEGTVIETSCWLKIKYATTSSTPAEVRFTDQVRCTRFTMMGDSGSAVLNRQNEVVGLHFAGSTSASFFNKIEHVFTLLQITLA